MTTFEAMMEAYNAYGRNHDPKQAERLLAEYRALALKVQAEQKGEG